MQRNEHLAVENDLGSSNEIAVVCEMLATGHRTHRATVEQLILVL